MAGMGLRLAQSQGMEGSTGNLHEFAISPSETTAIFSGDVVALNAAGFIEEASGATDNNDFDILGVFAGCKYVDVDGSFKFSSFWDGNSGRTEIKAQVIMPVGAQFLVRGHASGTYTQANTVGHRFGIDYTAGSTVYGDSRITLSQSAAATGPLLVHRLAPLTTEPANTWSSAEPWFIATVVRPQGNIAVAS